MENYFFETEETVSDDKVFVLIIYDIINDRQRVKFAKYLQGFGFRDDSVKVYKIIGKGQVTSFGKKTSIDDEEMILI